MSSFQREIVAFKLQWSFKTLFAAVLAVHILKRIFDPAGWRCGEFRYFWRIGLHRKVKVRVSDWDRLTESAFGNYVNLRFQ
jgi:hypothetical protein